MGFLDTILQPVLDVVGAVPVVGAPVAGLVGGTISTVAGITGVGGATNGGGGLIETIVAAPLNLVQDVVGTVVGGVGAGQVDMSGFGGGNGSFATRTIVETMDLRTGKITRRKVMEGSPHLMNKDVSAAKKLFRQVRKLDARMPRKTVRESKTKQLTDAAIDKAMRNVSTDCCPPKC